jgi:hypothetical protein
MALESYMKDLVRATSEVQIVNDNSASNLPSFECLSSSGEEFNVDGNASCRLSRSASEIRNTSCVCSSSRSECPRTPIHRRESHSILEDFRERQRLIRLSLSPGVSPRSPKKISRLSPPPSQAINPTL